MQYRESNNPDASKYVALWRSVIRLAQHDASTKKATRARNSARSWLRAEGTYNENNLRQVCKMAEIDADSLILMSRKSKYGSRSNAL